MFNCSKLASQIRAVAKITDVCSPAMGAKCKHHLCSRQITYGSKNYTLRKWAARYWTRMGDVHVHSPSNLSLIRIMIRHHWLSWMYSIFQTLLYSIWDRSNSSTSAKYYKNHQADHP